MALDFSCDLRNTSNSMPRFFCFFAILGALGREFTESANTKARNSIRAGMGGIEPVSHIEGFNRSLGTCRGVWVVLYSSSRACAALVYSSWTYRARLSLGLLESVSAIEKYPGGSCGESALASQMAPAWSNHAGGVLGMSWFKSGQELLSGKHGAGVKQGP